MHAIGIFVEAIVKTLIGGVDKGYKSTL